jgi:hypothetical protein
MFWYETDTNTLWKRNEANSAWISMGVFDESLGTFTPSGERALASQAQAEAGTDNTTLMTPLRTAEAITTTKVLNATAGATAGAVGSYAFIARNSLNASIVAGTTYAGSGFVFAGVSGANSYNYNTALNAGGTTPSGTWLAMGSATLGSDPSRGTLFLRIS